MAKKSAKPLNTLPVGQAVYVDGQDWAKIVGVFPEGSTSYLFPHYKVDIFHGDKNVAVKMDRVGVTRKKK